MPRRITLQPHLTTDELYRRYRACRRPQEKLRWRALYLISGGELANRAACRAGRRRPLDGAEGGGLDRRAHQRTRRCQHGLACHAPARLHLAGAAPAPPRRGDGRGAGRLQKKLADTLAQVKREHPAEAVELWTQDEARLGLKPVTRRVWAPKGGRPAAHARPGYEWLWLFAAVHPASGRVFWLVLPYLNAGMMQRFLDAFAREHAPAGGRIVMVLDGASAHRARSLRVPERITLVSLPAYTPELNPTERLWPAVKEGVANRSFDTLAELEAVVCVRCQKISAAPEQVTALTNYHWLPTA